MRKPALARIAAGMALGLAGCATTEAALSAAPTIAYTSPAPLPVVRDCLVRGGEAVKDYVKSWPLPPPQVTELSGVTKINFMNDSRLFAELRAVPGGTAVRYVRGVRKIQPASGVDDVVRACEAAR